jgi:hypothetical protein
MANRRLSTAELARRLEQCRADYDLAKAHMAEVGFICEGSVAEIYTCCRKPNCKCADPDRRHGPYYQFTWKQTGKTVSRRLSPEEARLYKQWIANRRQLDSVVRQMQNVSRRAGEYLLAETGRSLQGPERRPQPRRSGPKQSA